MIEEMPPKGPEIAGSNDLDTLRDLLFGNQVRDVSRRLTDLDSRVETARRDMKTALNQRADGLGKSNAEQVAALRKELSNRIDKETRSLAERIDSVAADFNNQLQAVHEELSERLDGIQRELGDRMHHSQEEARQRDDELRNETLALSAWLEDNKASRYDLGRMLEEVGQRLQFVAQNAAADGKNKK